VLSRCRYVNRPPVAEDRLALNATGHVRYQLESPYRDGTTRVVLEPVDLMARLAALVPPQRHAAMNSAPRLKRVFGIEIERCALCGRTLRIIACIEQPVIIAKILAHHKRTLPLPHQPELSQLGTRAPGVGRADAR